MDIVVLSPKGGETKIALDDRSGLQKDFLNKSYVSKVVQPSVVPLHTLWQVGLFDCFFHQHQKLTLCFFRPAALAKSTAAHVDLRT